MSEREHRDIIDRLCSATFDAELEIYRLRRLNAVLVNALGRARGYVISYDLDLLAKIDAAISKATSEPN